MTSVAVCASRFTGKERDSESGNDYFGARYYASSMGRFMSPDWSGTPVAVPWANFTNPQSLNLYSYAGNNPLVRIDKDGHCWSWLQGACDFFKAVGNEIRFGEFTKDSKLAEIRSLDKQEAMQRQMQQHPPTVTVGQVFWFGPMSGAAAASEGAAAASEGKGVTVLGHYPAYTNMAEASGANYFNVPTAEWNAMSSSEQWSMNQKSLDDAISRGDRFQLATPLDQVRPGSFYERELEYLQSKGYVPNATGTALTVPTIMQN
jgi:RHS repeat-associated protein